jgi:hypothetical protein
MKLNRSNRSQTHSEISPQIINESRRKYFVKWWNYLPHRWLILWKLILCRSSFGWNQFSLFTYNTVFRLFLPEVCVILVRFDTCQKARLQNKTIYIGENGALWNTGQNETRILFFDETNFKLVFAEKKNMSVSLCPRRFCVSYSPYSPYSRTVG